MGKGRQIEVLVILKYPVAMPGVVITFFGNVVGMNNVVKFEYRKWMKHKGICI